MQFFAVIAYRNFKKRFAIIILFGRMKKYEKSNVYIIYISAKNTNFKLSRVSGLLLFIISKKN